MIKINTDINENQSINTVMSLPIDDNDMDNFTNEKMSDSTHFPGNVFMSLNGERAKFYK